MAHLTYDFTAGDTGSKIRVRIVNSATGGLLVPFNGVYAATIMVKSSLGNPNLRAMTNLTGADDGQAEYQFTPTELAEGDLETQVRVTRISDSVVISELGIKVHKVGPRLV